MIAVNKLKGRIVECGYTQQEMAKLLNISPNTFARRLRKGVFGTDEMEKMMDILGISDANEYFFCKESNVSRNIQGV